MNSIVVRLLPYLIGGVLTFYCAEGLRTLFEHMTRVALPAWVFIPVWILSMFLLYGVFIAVALLCVVGCYVIVWIAERREKSGHKRIDNPLQ